MSAGRARQAPPAAVDAFAEALAEWLSSFTVSQELAAEMAAACSAGAPWAAALAGTSVRRAGWSEQEALAWGIAIGALAGALEAGRRSLAGPAPESGRAADGPALPLLAADGLIAASHEALSALDPERLAAALASFGDAFGDGGPWRHLGPEWPRPAWPPVVACGLGPAAADDPDGPWNELANAWRMALAAPRDPASVPGSSERRTAEGLASHPAADDDTNELFTCAADAARRGERGEAGDGERF